MYLRFVLSKGECYVMIFNVLRFCLGQRSDLSLMRNKVFQRFKKSNVFLSELIFSQIAIIFQISKISKYLQTGNSVVFFLKSRKYDAELVGLGGHRHSRLILHWLYYADCVLNENKAAQILTFWKESTSIWCIRSSHLFLCACYNKREY